MTARHTDFVLVGPYKKKSPNTSEDALDESFLLSMAVPTPRNVRNAPMPGPLGFKSQIQFGDIET